MWRLWARIFVVAYVLGLCGCGGGSGGGGSSAVVNIQSYSVFNHPAERRTRFVSKSVSIIGGKDSGVSWINQDSVPHRVVSGVVLSDGNPAIIHMIVINFGSFTPDTLTARSGETIRFNNLSGRQFTLQIVDDSGTVKSTVLFTQGEMKDVPFPGPGVFVARDTDSQQIATITLPGGAVADGLFDSGVLAPGQTFFRAFSAARTYDYFDANPSDPTRIYAIGRVVVQ